MSAAREAWSKRDRLSSHMNTSCSTCRSGPGTSKGAYDNSPKGGGFSPELLVHPGPLNPIAGRYGPGRYRDYRDLDSDISRVGRAKEFPLSLLPLDASVH